MIESRAGWFRPRRGGLSSAPVDLSLIGPDRREVGHVGELRLARMWVTVADVGGMAVGIGAAVALILALIV